MRTYKLIDCLGCDGTGYYITLLGRKTCILCKGTGKTEDYTNIWPNSPLK